MESCIDKNNNKIYIYDLENEYGIRNIIKERELRYLGETNKLICPECKNPVILKAGYIKSPHFAHKYKTESCLLNNYTYNHLRYIALKKLYMILKKDKYIIDFSLNKVITKDYKIDIYLKTSFDNREYAIILKNTSTKYSEWFEKHSLILQTGITPIYINYGIKEDIEKIELNCPRTFIHRNIFNLIGNKGLRFISVDTNELVSIIPEYHLDKYNKIKNFHLKKRVMTLNNDFEVVDLLHGQEQVTYKFENTISKKVNYTNILRAKDNKEPLLMINANGDLFLTIDIEESNYEKEEDYGTIKLQSFNHEGYFMRNKSNQCFHYYYPNNKILTSECYSEFNSGENIDSFLESWGNMNIRTFSITNGGFFKDIFKDYFSKDYIGFKLSNYNYISDNAIKIYNIIVEKDINNITIEEIKKIGKLLEINIPSEKLILIVENIEDLFFKNNIKNLIKNNCDKNIKFLFSIEDDQKYNFLSIIIQYFLKENIESLDCFKQLELLVVHYIEVNYFLKNNKDKLKLLLLMNKYDNFIITNKIKLSYENYLKNNDFRIFKNSLNNIEKNIIFDFLRDNLRQTIVNEDIKLFELSISYGVNQSIENELTVEEYINNPIKSKNNDIFKLILQTKNLKLIELYLDKYIINNTLDYSNLQSIANLIKNSIQVKKMEIIEFFKNKNILNMLDKNNNTLFSILCNQDLKKEYIFLGLKSGAIYDLKNNKGISVSDILKKKNFLF